METITVYKLKFSALRWSGIIEFLKTEANYFELDLKIEFRKTFFMINGSFVAKGTEENVFKFKKVVEDAFKEYNK